MTDAARSTANEPQPLTWEIGVSAGFHALLFAVLLNADRFVHDDSPFKPEDVMMVQAVALPKQTTRLPDKAMHTPDPVSGATNTPAPPTPTNPSDMVLQDPNAKPKPGEPTKDNTKDRDALLRDLKRQELLRDMSSPEGPEDHVQTDPNGVDPKDAILGSGATTPMDPVLARYISQCKERLLPNWTPLPTTLTAHPDYVVHLQVKVAADGTMSDPVILKGTGDASFDRSAILAVYKTATLPPPPDAYAASAAEGVIITLPAKDLH